MLKSGGPDTLLQVESALRQAGVTLLLPLLLLPLALQPRVNPGTSVPEKKRLRKRIVKKLSENSRESIKPVYSPTKNDSSSIFRHAFSCVLIYAEDDNEEDGKKRR